MQSSPFDSPTQADRGFVYQVARRIVRDDEEAQDVAQEALLMAYNRRHQFRGEAGYRTWLYRIASTAAIGALRRRKSRRRKADGLAALVAIAPTSVERPDHLLERRRTHEEIAAAVASLPPKYRDVIELRVNHDQSEQEIADTLDLTISAVKVRAFRARNQLRDLLVDGEAQLAA
jgi:RNA polymerase sigma-70 factor (ECF subfamily)